jgi:hypothetical protein
VLALLGAELAHAEDSDAAKQIATVSVPRGSLDQGLAALGRQTGLKLVYPSALTTGKKTVGVAGRMTVKDAVQRLAAQRHGHHARELLMRDSAKSNLAKR